MPRQIVVGFGEIILEKMKNWRSVLLDLRAFQPQSGRQRCHQLRAALRQMMPSSSSTDFLTGWVMKKSMSIFDCPLFCSFCIFRCYFFSKRNTSPWKIAYFHCHKNPSFSHRRDEDARRLSDSFGTPTLPKCDSLLSLSLFLCFIYPLMGYCQCRPWGCLQIMLTSTHLFLDHLPLSPAACLTKVAKPQPSTCLQKDAHIAFELSLFENLDIFFWNPHYVGISFRCEYPLASVLLKFFLPIAYKRKTFMGRVKGFSLLLCVEGQYVTSHMHWFRKFRKSLKSPKTTSHPSFLSVISFEQDTLWVFFIWIWFMFQMIEFKKNLNWQLTYYTFSPSFDNL